MTTRHELRAMGTTVAIRLDGDPQPAIDFVRRSEARFSRFVVDSELCELNRKAGTASLPGPDMLDLLTAAARVRTLTDGLVDIGVGAAVEAWGYDRSFDSGLSLTDPPSPTSRLEWTLSDTALTIRSGASLDLGGVAKGWVCDRLVTDGLCEVASAGGDLRSANPDLVVEIEALGNIIEVSVGIGALATSSTLRRRWTVGGRRVSHLIDPRTMQPVESPIVSATVIADTAVEAEAGAKAVLLHGVDGLAWADHQPWVRRAVAVWHDGSVFSTTEESAAWS